MSLKNFTALQRVLPLTLSVCSVWHSLKFCEHKLITFCACLAGAPCILHLEFST